MRHFTANRKDANHGTIAAAFEAHGWLVFDVSDSRSLGLDLIVVRRERCIAVEIKDGTKIPSKRALKPSEERTRDRCKANCAEWALVESVDDVLRLMAPAVQPATGGRDVER